ncbi:phenylacetic acid degradation bifunctional protein PaaZ [Pseudodonghicola flavimaris]|uniref:Phenylacetic acid degradation bifunctional protein PaaZ n=1 Tax=Pseudodonghicola flavimaris TaxID=3050036 RepID=A0ABT7F2X2_9RHOB|nr:phenylacetic acid degradation bifunctional protein PaaZ [Pseudodonghicola flavimaris]MDK3018947.1 phenylacetic acid degradation bifunctional protein PaaZ [Pseudodonghicola flavimaris]
MSIQKIASFAAGEWIAPGAGARQIASAITGAVIAEAGNGALDMQAMLDYARGTGGPALRAMTFHQRARMLKALGQHLNAHKQALYDISFDTGATQSDHMIDIDGGIGTLFVFASKGRREMPDDHIYLDGGIEQLGRTGSFLGQHVCTPLHGVGVHINAFNFPVWGMLEKLAPTLLAGVPAIVKPATDSCYVTERAVRIMLESGILPAGALQLITGGVGDLLERLGMQDVVSFTGSADTANLLRSNRHLLENSVRFVAEQDSLNASILGPDAVPGTPEFDLFVKEVSREMTAKAGQKCTAIRRILAPESQVGAVIEALSARLSKVVIGDPRAETTRMGALVSARQKADVLERAALIGAEAERVFGDPENFTVEGADKDKGAFLPPMLFHCADPDGAARVHDTEAFGPVSTVMGYRDLDHAIDIAKRGQGSLVASVITHDPAVARRVVLGAAAWHGRIYINDRVSMKESTGHGSPLPHLVHGGPGRAGGGEEMGGVRGVKHYMQRTAIQGSPDMISAIGSKWVPGATEIEGPAHPFTRRYGELSIGETLHSAARTVTLEDIEHFAAFTGDTFYAHMDEAAAARNPFFPGRVAHGYLLLSFAAGLFVEPNEGPVLANTGLDNLRFMKPVVPGDSVKVRLTVKQKTPRTDDYGEVRWNVTLTNQDGDQVAEYELLTMNAF